MRYEHVLNKLYLHLTLKEIYNYFKHNRKTKTTTNDHDLANIFPKFILFAAFVRFCMHINCTNKMCNMSILDWFMSANKVLYYKFRWCIFNIHGHIAGTKIKRNFRPIITYHFRIRSLGKEIVRDVRCR